MVGFLAIRTLCWLQFFPPAQYFVMSVPHLPILFLLLSRFHFLVFCIWPVINLLYKILILLSFFFFKVVPTTCGGSQARGLISATAAGLHYSYSNTRSEPRLWHIHHISRQCRILTHWARPGIKPVSSWIQVGFISTEPRWELPDSLLTILH